MELGRNQRPAEPSKASPRGAPGRFYDIVKRCFDVMVSIFALLLLSPVMLFIAVAVYREDGGPVIHRRRCVCAKGTYDMLNLRWMELVRRLHEKLGHIEVYFCSIQTTNFCGGYFRHQNGLFPAVETG